MVRFPTLTHAATAKIKAIEDCHAYIVRLENQRNTALKEVRTGLPESRLFMVKKAVVRVAFGKDEADEVCPGAALFISRLTGESGLMFSNMIPADLKKALEQFERTEYARSGFVAPCDVTVPKGPQTQFSHSLEPQLRKLGLPTTLVKGVVTTEVDFALCRRGDVLTSEQARLLVLYNRPLAPFRIALESVLAIGSGQITTLEQAGPVVMDEDVSDDDGAVVLGDEIVAFKGTPYERPANTKRGKKKRN